MIQDFEKLKTSYEDYDENNLRSTEIGVIDKHLDHYKKRIVAQYDNFKGLNILEIGCGEGKVTKEFAKLYPENKFTAVDLSENNIDIANKNNKTENIDYMQMDVSKDIKFTEKFNLIYSFSTVQYFDYSAFYNLSEKLYDQLNEGGMIIHMSIPDKDFFWKMNIGNGVLAPVKLILKYPFLIKEFFNNTYGNGFYWDKNEIKRISDDKYHVEVFDSDSFYRLDVIQRRK